MNRFIFPKQLKAELQFLINNSSKLDGVLCFHGLPGCGKTSFSKYFSNLVAKETLYLDACSHIFDKSSAGNILRIIQDSRITLSAFPSVRPPKIISIKLDLPIPSKHFTLLPPVYSVPLAL